jgi:hypothetical protein
MVEAGLGAALAVVAAALAAVVAVVGLFVHKAWKRFRRETPDPNAARRNRRAERQTSLYMSVGSSLQARCAPRRPPRPAGCTEARLC